MTSAPPARHGLRLVLASASPARLSTLRTAGIAPAVEVSAVDEPAVLAAEARARSRALTVPEQVAVLARAKARDVAARLARAGEPEPFTLVLGCDSLLEMDGTGHGKPGSPAEARDRWRAMSGRSGVLHTGHHLRWLDHDGAGAGEKESAPRPDGPASAEAVSSTVVHFAALESSEIDAYVATGEPLAVAGAFTIDGIGGGFVTGVEGDYHGVVGLSLPLLRELVRELGLPYPALWSGTV